MGIKQVSVTTYKILDFVIAHSLSIQNFIDRMAYKQQPFISRSSGVEFIRHTRDYKFIQWILALQIKIETDYPASKIVIQH